VRYDLNAHNSLYQQVLIVPRGQFATFFVVLSLAPGVSLADPPHDATAPTSWWARVSDDMSATWQSNRYALYVPLDTWHNRYMYTPQEISQYNERPWGLGVARYRYDQDGNWHAWYAMAFLDSHRKVEPAVGYGYQKIWHPAEDWRLGAGVTAGLTARADYGYLPLPVLLPLVSVGVGRLTLQSTYVPGGKGFGNVLFTCLLWQF
jgi:palmitoyl transferase